MCGCLIHDSLVWTFHCSHTQTHTHTHARAHFDDPPSAHFRKLSELHRAATRPLPSPSSAPQRLSPRLHSEEEPGAPGRPLPVTLPPRWRSADGTASVHPPPRPPVCLQWRFRRDRSDLVPSFSRFSGGFTREILSSGRGSRQPWAPGKERRRRRRTPAT